MYSTRSLPKNGLKVATIKPTTELLTPKNSESKHCNFQIVNITHLNVEGGVRSRTALTLSDIFFQ